VYRKLICVPVLVLLSLQCFAQSGVDSLKQVLTTQSGAARIPTLLVLSQQNLYFDSEQAKKYAEEALALAISAKDDLSKPDAYYYLGFSIYRLGNYTLALDYLDKSVKGHYQNKNFVTMAIAKNLMAIINYYIGRYEISTKLYSQNLVYYKSKNMMKDYSKMLINLATVYLQKGDYDKALDNLFKAESYIKQNAPNDAYLVGNIACNIGEAYSGKKDYDTALKYYMTAQENLKKIGLTDGVANTQIDIGSAYLEMKEYAKALDYYNQARNNYKQIKYAKGIMDASENIIRFLKNTGQPDKALSELHGLEAMGIEAKDTLILAKCYNHYAEVYELKNNYVETAKYYKKYRTLQNIIDEQAKKQNIIGLQVLTDAEEKEMENTTLKQENELQKEKMKSGLLVLFSVTGGLLLFVIFLLILYRKEKNIRKYASLLEKKNEEINRQNVRLEEAVLAQNKFFSILAHNLKNPFWAILGLNKMLDENYNDLPDAEKKEMITQIGSSVENVYKLFENLLSWGKTQQAAIKACREHLNLKEVINNSIKIYEIRAMEKNVAISVEADENISVFADKFMLETVLGNIIDNAIKFSEVESEVKVTAAANEKEVSISIKDSGIGMSKAKIDKLFKIDEDVSSEGTLKEKGTGLGLIICKEFIKLNNGEVSVESIPKEGTKFTIRIPNE